MAREPYRSRMLAALLSLPEADQVAVMREFVVHEAGSSHSDVVAARNMEKIIKTFTPWRTGFPDQTAAGTVPVGGDAPAPWWESIELPPEPDPD